MQQQAFLNKEAIKTYLSKAVLVVLFLFAGVSAMMAQNWKSSSEARISAMQASTDIRVGLQSLQPGTLAYEKQIRQMTMFNKIAEFIKIDPNVGLAVNLAIATAFTPTLSNPPALQPVKGEDAEGRAAAISALTN